MKTKSSYLFVVFILLMLIGLIELNDQFREYFSDRKEILTRSEVLARTVERQKLKVQLAESQNWDFQQEVARLLPVKSLIQSHKDFQLAELAQTVRAPASEAGRGLQSDLLITHGREAFRRRHFDEAANLFRQSIEKYPTSAQVIEAHFLLGESLYQAGRGDECLDVVYQMLNHFPENEMTGYLLLRNGQILQTRNRTQEAGEVFHMIQEKFASNRSLQEQARRLASE
jgi:TolA-binding protein